MSKTKKIRTVELSGSLSDYVDIGADASNVDLLNGTNVEDAIKEINEAGYIDRDVTGLKNYTTTEDLEANYTQKSEFNEKIESVEAKVSSIYRPMGSVETYDALADKEATAEVGDVWNVVDTDKNYAWTAQSEWDDLGGKVDLSNYYTKEETYNKDEVDSQIEGIVSGDLGAYLKKEDADKKYLDKEIAESTYVSKTEGEKYLKAEKATDEADAQSKSQQNSNIMYYWVEAE